jgi:hypothetical protein
MLIENKQVKIKKLCDNSIKETSRIIKMVNKAKRRDKNKK